MWMMQYRMDIEEGTFKGFYYIVQPTLGLEWEWVCYSDDHEIAIAGSEDAIFGVKDRAYLRKSGFKSAKLAMKNAEKHFKVAFKDQ